MLRSWVRLLALAAGALAGMAGPTRAQNPPPKVPFEKLSTENIRQAFEYSLSNKLSTAAVVLQDQGITPSTTDLVYTPPSTRGGKGVLNLPYTTGVVKPGVAALGPEARENILREFVDQAAGQHLLEGNKLFRDLVTVNLTHGQTGLGGGPSLQGSLSLAQGPFEQGGVVASPQSLFMGAPPSIFAGEAAATSGVLSADESYSRGYDLYWQGRYPEALAHFNQAVGMKPNDASSWYYKGLTEVAMGDSFSGEASLRQGGEVERGGRANRREVGRSLARVQGPVRLWLERVARR